MRDGNLNRNGQQYCGFTSTNDTYYRNWNFAGSIGTAHTISAFINPTFNKGTTFPSSPWYFAVAVNGYGAVSNVHIRMRHLVLG